MYTSISISGVIVLNRVVKSGSEPFADCVDVCQRCAGWQELTLWLANQLSCWFLAVACGVPGGQRRPSHQQEGTFWTALLNCWLATLKWVAALFWSRLCLTFFCLFIYSYIYICVCIRLLWNKIGLWASTSWEALLQEEQRSEGGAREWRRSQGVKEEPRSEAVWLTAAEKPALDLLNFLLSRSVLKGKVPFLKEPHSDKKMMSFQTVKWSAQIFPLWHFTIDLRVMKCRVSEAPAEYLSSLLTFPAFPAHAVGSGSEWAPTVYTAAGNFL